MIAATHQSLGLPCPISSNEREKGHLCLGQRSADENPKDCWVSRARCPFLVKGTDSISSLSPMEVLLSLGLLVIGVILIGALLAFGWTHAGGILMIIMLIVGGLILGRILWGILWVIRQAVFDAKKKKYPPMEKPTPPILWLAGQHKKLGIWLLVAILGMMSSTNSTTDTEDGLFWFLVGIAALVMTLLYLFKLAWQSSTFYRVLPFSIPLLVLYTLLAEPGELGVIHAFKVGIAVTFIVACAVFVHIQRKLKATGLGMGLFGAKYVTTKGLWKPDLVHNQAS
jgi:hypothetical protein